MDLPRQKLLGIEKARIVGHNIGLRFTEACVKGHGVNL